MLVNVQKEYLSTSIYFERYLASTACYENATDAREYVCPSF